MKFTEQERDFLKQEFADLCHAAINSMITAGSFVRSIDRIEAIVSERITPEPGESVKPVPSIPIVGGGSVASDRTEQCESAKEFLSKTTASGVIERKGVGEYSMSFDIDKLASILTIYASQVCADKEREMGLLKNELAKAKEEIEKSHMDKIYSIHDLKSELSAANESLTVMVRKNAELLESVRPDVVVPSEKEVKSDLIYHSYLDGKNKGWNECLSELRHLNPTMTFTELNHEK